MKTLKLKWQPATVLNVKRETRRAKTFTIRPEKPFAFIAGQHVDIRLTALDGYQAQRSYSIASAPDIIAHIEITIEVLDNGEVSPYLHSGVEPGDRIEIRGPIGGPFTWQPSTRCNLFLLAAGSGIVPIMSIMRHRATLTASARAAALLLYSSRSQQDIIYRSELETMNASDDRMKVIHTLTQSQPPHWSGYCRRVDSDMVRQALIQLNRLVDAEARSELYTVSYICGASDFVENSTRFTVEAGILATRIHTERFGPTGT